jgi:arylsulfatase A-like enzyme
MTRPLTILLLAVLAGVTLPAVPAAAPGADQDVPTEPPNVLVIVTDDQRTDTMEAMPRTSRLFAEQGTTFSDAYSTTPLCCPSRASIMTGLYAHNHNVETQSRAGTTLDVGQTIQRYLSESNYYTGIIGKWLNGWALEVEPPYLNEVAIFTSSGTAYTDAEWNVDGKVKIVPGYSTDFVRKRTEGFLARAETIDDQPWFLLVTPPQPHSPFQPQDRFATETFGQWESSPAVGEEDKTDKPPWVETKKAGRYQGRRLRTRQLRTLRSVDELVAATFRSLRDYGESSNTLAIFTSDNGYLWGEHGIANIKRFPYTPSVQVPMFMRWPGHVAPGVVDSRFAANIDIAPTVLEAAGNVDRASQLDGRSLLQPSTRQRILLEYWQGDGNPLGTWASLRSSSYQYIEYYDPSGMVFYREYYDLTEDPYELENLLDNGNVLDDPEWVTISNDLEQMRSCSGPTCP